MSGVCKNCETVIDAFNSKMVMLREDLWLSIANKKDILCDKCIEEKLGRRINARDFKIGTNPNLNFKIQVNLLYAQINGLKY